MSECTHDCSTCGEACASRQNPQDLHEKPHELSKIGKVIAVVSGKGTTASGTGKQGGVETGDAGVALAIAGLLAAAGTAIVARKKD